MERPQVNLADLAHRIRGGITGAAPGKHFGGWTQGSFWRRSDPGQDSTLKNRPVVCLNGAVLAAEYELLGLDIDDDSRAAYSYRRDPDQLFGELPRTDQGREVSIDLADAIMALFVETGRWVPAHVSPNQYRDLRNDGPPDQDPNKYMPQHREGMAQHHAKRELSKARDVIVGFNDTHGRTIDEIGEVTAWAEDAAFERYLESRGIDPANGNVTT